jgi:hypothetical protein
MIDDTNVFQKKRYQTIQINLYQTLITLKWLIFSVSWSTELQLIVSKLVQLVKFLVQLNLDKIMSVRKALE